LRAAEKIRSIAENGKFLVAGNRCVVVGRKVGCTRYLRLVYFVVDEGDGEKGKSYTKADLGKWKLEYEQMQLYLSTYDPFLPAFLRHKSKYVRPSFCPLIGSKDRCRAMDGNSLKFEVVGAGGEGYVECGCPEDCLMDAAGWFRSAGSSQLA
jgi:hypothetical protein